MESYKLPNLNSNGFMPAKKTFFKALAVANEKTNPISSASLHFIQTFNIL